MNTLEKFLNVFSLHQPMEKASPKVLDFFREKLPQEIISLWENYGFGNIQNGFLKLINPLDYHEILLHWLDLEDENYKRLPLVMTAFSDLFYIRLHDDGLYDFSVLSIHFKRVAIVSEDVAYFFNDFLTDPEIQENALRKSLFHKALATIGQTKCSEIYFFAPALCLGGSQDIAFVEKGDAQVHQMLLLEM